MSFLILSATSVVIQGPSLAAVSRVPSFLPSWKGAPHWSSFSLARSSPATACDGESSTLSPRGNYCDRTGAAAEPPGSLHRGGRPPGGRATLQQTSSLSSSRVPGRCPEGAPVNLMTIAISSSRNLLPVASREKPRAPKTRPLASEKVTGAGVSPPRVCPRVAHAAAGRSATRNRPGGGQCPDCAPGPWRCRAGSTARTPPPGTQLQATPAPRHNA